MVWDGGNAPSGFSTGKPWLPIKAPQAARHVAGQTGDPDSVLEFYRRDAPAAAAEPRRCAAGGRGSSTTSEPVLAFTRGGETVLCVFNLSPERHEVALAGGGAVALSQAVGARGGAAAAAPQRVRDHGGDRGDDGGRLGRRATRRACAMSRVRTVRARIM